MAIYTLSNAVNIQTTKGLKTAVNKTNKNVKFCSLF